MAILIVSETATVGTVAVPEMRVYGEVARSRTYTIDNGYVLVDGADYIVAAHVEEICALPGFRLATAQEQEAYFAKVKKGRAIKEVAATSAKEVVGG